MVSDVRREDEIYQMYSAIILSVYGVRSKFSRPSSLFMVKSSYLEAKTLNLAELLIAPFLFCFNIKEVHIFPVIGLEGIELFVILICHCEVGAKICAILAYSSLKNIE
jgi:hypothetical protein